MGGELGSALTVKHVESQLGGQGRTEGRDQLRARNESAAVDRGAHGQDPSAVSRPYLARVLWFLGDSDQARAHAREALRLAEARAHRYSLGLALYFSATFHHGLRDAQAVQARAATARMQATKHVFAFLAAGAKILGGWSLTAQGGGADGIAQIRAGLADAKAVGAARGRSYWLALLAESHGNEGHVEAAVSAVDEALAVARQSGECYSEPGLHRLRGALMLGMGAARDEQAETCLRQALDSARRQGAKALELRAAVSLSRLWLAQGRSAEGYELLSAIHHSFAEGLDTADLQAAKLVLDRLAQECAGVLGVPAHRRPQAPPEPRREPSGLAHDALPDRGVRLPPRRMLRDDD